MASGLLQAISIKQSMFPRSMTYTAFLEQYERFFPFRLRPTSPPKDRVAYLLSRLTSCYTVSHYLYNKERHKALDCPFQAGTLPLFAHDSSHTIQHTLESLHQDHTAFQPVPYLFGDTLVFLRTQPPRQCRWVNSGGQSEWNVYYIPCVGRVNIAILETSHSGRSSSIRPKSWHSANASRRSFHHPAACHHSSPSYMSPMISGVGTWRRRTNTWRSCFPTCHIKPCTSGRANHMIMHTTRKTWNAESWI